jgi:glutamate-1-semialdehyde 2,1-aminomutase
MSDIIQKEIAKYLTRTPKSYQKQKEAEKVLPGGSSRGTAYFDPYPHFIDSGHDHYIVDVDGNEYLDFMINATSLILGHANSDVTDVIKDQAEKGVAFSGPTDSQIRLAKILTDRIPSVDTIRFTNSGTEGTLMAIRAAREFTGREKIVKIEGGYHGSHEYVAVSVYPAKNLLDPDKTTAIPEYSNQPDSVLENVIVVPYNDIEETTRMISMESENVACVIMEPIVSSFGYTPADLDYLQFVRDITTELGIILIYDEVQSFRVGPGGAQELFGVVPDMTTLGKIIGGGMPVGAFGGRRDIMALFDPTNGGADIAHAGTFNANPVTMRAGEVVMNALTPDVYHDMNDLGEKLRNQLRAVFDELGVDAQVTGVGSLFGIHFTANNIRNYRDVVKADPQMKRAFFIGMLNEGILLQGSAAGALNVFSDEHHVGRLVDSARKVVQRIR